VQPPGDGPHARGNRVHHRELQILLQELDGVQAPPA